MNNMTEAVFQRLSAQTWLLLIVLISFTFSIAALAQQPQLATELSKELSNTLKNNANIQTKTLLAPGQNRSNITPRTISQIMRQIDSYYVDEVNVDGLLENAIKEVFKQLDPHSTYLNEHELNALFEMANGQYDGLGIEVELRNGVLVILTTLKNSPAEMAGLSKGDVVESINGIDIHGLSLEKVSLLIKDSTQKTQLKIKRDDYQEPLEFTIEKGKIDVESVSQDLLANDIGYVKIYTFQASTTADIESAVSKLQTRTDNNLKGLIIDLRDNPGGVLDSAVGVSDLFLNQGTIVTTRGRFNDANHNFTATPGDMMDNKPIYVLINRGSASASEIVAGALKENHRATIVGMPSFGKGSVQSLIPLGNGNTAIKLTTALYFTPDGLSINGIGIKPDVEIPQQQLDSGAQSPIMGLDNQWGISGKMLANRDFQLAEAQKLVLEQILH